MSMDWEERSPTDGSLGAPLPGGGSIDSDEGSGGGVVFNLGVGYASRGPFEIRLETPVLLTFAPPGGASAVVPTAILRLGVRF